MSSNICGSLISLTADFVKIWSMECQPRSASWFPGMTLIWCLSYDYLQSSFIHVCNLGVTLLKSGLVFYKPGLSVIKLNIMRNLTKWQLLRKRKWSAGMASAFNFKLPSVYIFSIVHPDFVPSLPNCFSGKAVFLLVRLILVILVPC